MSDKEPVSKECKGEVYGYAFSLLRREYEELLNKMDADREFYEISGKDSELAKKLSSEVDSREIEINVLQRLYEKIKQDKDIDK